MSEERVLLVDASVFITLSRVGATEILLHREDEIVVPRPVANEITSEPSAAQLAEAADSDRVALWDAGIAPLLDAADHLGKDLTEDEIIGQQHLNIEGDIAPLALAMADDLYEPKRSTADSPVVLTDDKPLRKTCKALSIPVSGSIGVLVHAVERGDLDAREAKAILEAMDEVGARLSASLYRTAERLIDDAAE